MLGWKLSGRGDAKAYKKHFSRCIELRGNIIQEEFDLRRSPGKLKWVVGTQRCGIKQSHQWRGVNKQLIHKYLIHMQIKWRCVTVWAENLMIWMHLCFVATNRRGRNGLLPTRICVAHGLNRCLVDALQDWIKYSQYINSEARDSLSSFIRKCVIRRAAKRMRGGVPQE